MKKLKVMTGGRSKSEQARPTNDGQGGIFRDVDTFEGEAFNLYNANGKRIGRWTAVAGVTDDELIIDFGELLERQNPPQPKLVTF